MKDLIAMCAVFLLLMTFPLQYALNTKNHYSMSLMQKHVNNAKEVARQDGYFTADTIKSLKTSISNDFGIKDTDVIIEVTEVGDKKVRGELIHYKVTVPLNQIIAANVFWGITDQDNRASYVIENFAASEWVTE